MTHLHPAPPASPVSPPPAGTPRWVWALLMLLIAALVAVIAGLLDYADDASTAHAILFGGGAFAGTVALLLGVAHFLRDGG